MRNYSTYIPRRQSKSAIVLLAVCLLAAMCVPHASADAATQDPLDGLADRLQGMPPQEQIDLLQSYLKDGMSDARIHFHLGIAWFALEQPDSAVAQFQDAVRLDKNYSKAYVNMGIVYDAKGDYRKARAAYEGALQVNPDDVLAYCHLGYNYYARQMPEKAIEYYNKALAIDPNSAQAHYNLGLAFANAKIFKEALVEWNKVIELDPDGELGKIASENVELIQTYMELDK
jgi:tetratricopeptide (TPR) repeat protein